MRHPEFPIVSFLSILLLLCSLPSHIRAGSVSTMSLIAWLGIMSLIRGINTIIWANNFVVRLEVWCDITTKITIGFTYAVPASALCILRHLESVSSTRHVMTTKADKRRRQKFEALMCFGLPIFFMALHYIVQGHRFDLFEDIGCAPTVYFSVAAIFIIWVPPMLMSLTTFVYAAMAIRHFLHHRIEFAAHLRNSQAALSPTRYFRLMAMAIVEMVWDTGVNAYVIYFNTFDGLRPWISWANVHSNFSRVQLFPEIIIPPEFKVQLIFQWWIIPVSCVCFFVFFGFGEEAMSDYRATINWFRRTILRQKIDKPRGYGNSSALPFHRPRTLDTRSTSVTVPSLSDGSSIGNIKSYDELSLKMPEITEDLHMQSVHAPPAFVNTANPTSFETPKPPTDPGHTTSSLSMSLDDSDRSISIYASYATRSSSYEEAGPSTPPQTVYHSTLRATTPAPDSSIDSDLSTQTETSSSRRQGQSPTPSLHDISINVSQAYPPGLNVDNDDQPSSRDTSSTFPSRQDLQDPQVQSVFRVTHEGRAI